MKKVTVKELAQILLEKKTQKGAAIFAHIVQYTDPKLKKTNNPYIGTMKESELSILLNTEYETGVLNQLKREEKEPTEYVKGKNTMPLVFGENNRFIGFFNGEPVLQYRPFDNSKPKVKYFFNGNEINKLTIAPFLPASSHATNQGTDKEIFWRKLYLSNVKQLNFDGEQYEIV
jgi:hypothetical protein